MKGISMLENILRVVQICLILTNCFGFLFNAEMTSDINSAAEEADQA